MRRTIRRLRACLFAFALLGSGCLRASPLGEQIQKELDASAVLAEQHLKMRVAEERQGNVTLELTAGPKQLRDLFRRGYEISGSAFADENLEAASVKALRSVKRTLALIKKLPKVKEIALTGALDPVPDFAANHSATSSSQGMAGNTPWASPLREQIQKELDGSPFLAESQLKMRVAEEREGAITLELSEGPKQLRDLFRRGYEINSSALTEANLKEDSVQALRSVRKMLTVIKGFRGVKAISWTGALDPEPTRPEEPKPQQAASPLREQIQKELDSNASLVGLQLKMRVTEERQGSVTMELTEGPKQLRDLFRRGYEINGTALAEANLEENAVDALRGLRRALATIKGFPGVQAISLTGALDPVSDAAMNPADVATPSGPASNPAWSSPLAKQIQKELDASPFLPEQELKMRVLDERQGHVTLELSEGPKKLRDMFRMGYELNGTGLRETNLKPEIIQALRSIRKTLGGIKRIEGVKEIVLTGALHLGMDAAEDFYEKACQILNQSDSQARAEEGIPLLMRAAELGYAPAQADLAKAYGTGVDVRSDDAKAFYWLQKAAEQGDALCQYNLGAFYVAGRGKEKNYTLAIQYFRKAAEQDRNRDVSARSIVALASLLATCPDESVRDGEAALEYAKKGIAATPSGVAIEVLAAAYARCGRFAEAIEQEKKWIQELEAATSLSSAQKESLIDRAKYRLELYQSHQPYATQQ